MFKKLAFLFFLLIITLGCGPATTYNKIVSLDISGSNETQIDSDVQKTIGFLNNSNNKSLLAYYCFNNNSYELYVGERPAKDRDLIKLIKNGTLEASKVTAQQGTNVLHMTKHIDYALKSFNSKNQLATEIYILTDGFFELSTKTDWEEAIRLINSWDHTKVSKVYISGLNLANKEQIKKMFSSFDSQNKLVFIP